MGKGRRQKQEGLESGKAARSICASNLPDANGHGVHEAADDFPLLVVKFFEEEIRAALAEVDAIIRSGQ